MNHLNRFHRLLVACLVVLMVIVGTRVEPIRAQKGGDEEGSAVPPMNDGEKAESDATTTTTTTASDDSSSSTTTSSSSKGNNNGQEEQQQKAKTQEENELPRRPKEVLEDNFDASSRDWGSYYDPKNIFCGKYDCYKILGFDYDAFGKNPPDTKIITKRYRKLSREWHPDKSKHRDAKERFVKIARAYEVLTDVKVRKEYDSMRFDQEAYFSKYGTSVLWSYAPKTDVTFVMILIFVLANVVSLYLQKHRWQLVANRLTKAAVEDWTTAQGGTPESKELREHALAILQEKSNGTTSGGGDAATDESNTATAENNNNNNSNNTNNKKAVTKKQKGSRKEKVSGREKKKMEEEALLPIVKTLVNEMHDFGGGFHKPTWRDLLIVTLIKAPFQMTNAIYWNLKYYIRRVQKLDLSEDERQVLTRRAVGPVVWDTKSQEDRQDMMNRELWKLSNLADWEEEQEIKNMSAADQKQYFKQLKKKGKLE